ncbi:hypothetical protein KJW57_00285 [Streptococcus lutetiensis]|uniref:hypothetical protein n=1 Tax=Streptococcus lutetiensis TaxID=150055 RepID=UPI001BD9FBEB|nr:hypothetical protein [Streptococcus lutetiensis]MBT0897679.1 hypothetical protein [Streptococcus lutetiensis]MBT1056430.1 hypothetical protein [Streptococcus lutetiensis]MBT1058186.1 hypothetical protein [Streptococcus lutetiensis]
MNLEELKYCLNSIDDYAKTTLYSTVGSFQIDNWIEFDRRRDVLVFLQGDEVVTLKINAIHGYSVIPKK